MGHGLSKKIENTLSDEYRIFDFGCKTKTKETYSLWEEQILYIVQGEGLQIIEDERIHCKKKGICYISKREVPMRH